MPLRSFLALSLLCLWPLPIFATDLTKIDRTIAKEPAYKNKPKYCLLVFGLEAKHRVWLVQDGDVLYVDKNGNGDLTEAGEKVAAEKNEGAEPAVFTFTIPELRVGERLHRNMRVEVDKLERYADGDKRIKPFLAKNPDARAYFVVIDVEVPGWKGSGIGGRVAQAAGHVAEGGINQFADRVQDAPILHFDGPLRITLSVQAELRIGREEKLTLGVGSRGHGPGTQTIIAYDGVMPDNAHPTLEIIFPPAKPGLPPIREKYELKDRC